MSSRLRRSQKRRSRENSLENGKSYTDFLCPICLEILIEPVQMPCKHELCMECFKGHVEDTSLTCPMCRLRIAVWVRKNMKSNTLINKERWELIKRLFPDRVKRRLEGGDDLEESFSIYNAPKHVIAPQGEVRREFEEQMKKLEEEQEAAQRENLEFIKKLQLQEQMERQQQEELDAAAAHALQQEEMSNLGVTLKSPTQHQRQLLAMMKPKSPMRLRQRPVLPNTSTSGKKRLKAQRKLLTSPNNDNKITNFFRKSDGNQNIDPYTPPVVNNSFNINIDSEIAAQLQKNYEKQLKESEKKPLRARTQTSTHTITRPLRKKIKNNSVGNDTLEQRGVV